MSLKIIIIKVPSPFLVKKKGTVLLAGDNVPLRPPFSVWAQLSSGAGESFLERRVSDIAGCLAVCSWDANGTHPMLTTAGTPHPAEHVPEA